MSWLYGHVKQTLSLASIPGKTRSFELWQEAVVTVERENGLGVGSGLLCPSLQESKATTLRS